MPSRVGERSECRIPHTLQMAELEAKSRVTDCIEKTNLPSTFLAQSHLQITRTVDGKSTDYG